MARKSKVQLQEEKDKAEAELKFQLVIYKRLLAQKSDLQKEMDEIRESIETTMVSGRFDKYDDRLSLLSVSRRRNTPSRRFAYDKLKKTNKAMYDSLTHGGFITETEPKTEFKLEVRHLKPTKKDLDEWEQRAAQDAEK